MTNAQALARSVALEILKSYNSQLKVREPPSPEDRERGQSAAFVTAEKFVREYACSYSIDPDWLDQPSEES